MDNIRLTKHPSHLKNKFHIGKNKEKEKKSNELHNIIIFNDTSNLLQ